MPHYILAQYTGALTGACLVFFLYWDALVWYEHQQGIYRSVPDTAVIFSSFPSPHLTHLGGAGDQVLATALLTTLICTLTDNKYLLIGFMRIKQILFSRTFLIHPILLPAVVGCTILGLGTSLGYNCSYPLNPARDLAPRIFMGNKSLRYFTYQQIIQNNCAALSGWGWEVFNGFNHWWLVPILACHLGGVLGAVIYWLLLHSDHDSVDVEKLIREVTTGTATRCVGQGRNHLHASFTLPKLIFQS